MANVVKRNPLGDILVQGSIASVALDPADIPNPASGQVVIFPDSTNSNKWSQKDSSGTVAVLGGDSSILNKFDATTAPTVDNDTTEGYSVGSRWIDVTNDKVYDCVDATEGEAVWNEVGAGTGGGGGGADAVSRRLIAEMLWDNMVDDGDSALNFTDGFVDVYEDSTGVDFDNSVNTFPNVFNDSYVKLFLDGDVSPFVDDSSSAKTLTNSGATLDTTNKKYGAGSISLDGSSHISAPASTDWDLGSTWTIDAWIRPTTVSGEKVILSTRNDSEPSPYGWGLTISSGKIAIKDYYVIEIAGVTDIPTDTWTHVAITFDGSNIRLWVNGVLDKTQATASTWDSTDSDLWIGQSEAYPGETFAGQVDRLRISKGVVRWTENFDPEQDALPGYLGTIDYGTVLDMTAISETYTSAISPTSGSIDMLIETAGTADTDWFVDILASTGNWTNAPLTLVEDYGSNIKRYSAEATLSSTDTNRAYRIRTANNTAFKCTRILHIWE